VDEIKIDVVELAFLKACLKRRFNALGTVIGVPKFRGNEHILPLDLPRLERVFYRFADLFFSSITFRSIAGAKACFECRPSRIFGYNGVGNQRSKTERGNCA